MKGKENDTRSAISTDDLGNIAFSDLEVDLSSATPPFSIIKVRPYSSGAPISM